MARTFLASQLKGLLAEAPASTIGRRDALKLAMAAPFALQAATSPRVVVVGGGLAGLTSQVIATLTK